MGQWFGLTMIAALHPVNALVLTYASLTLAKRSNAYWTTRGPMRRPPRRHPALQGAGRTFAA